METLQSLLNKYTARGAGAAVRRSAFVTEKRAVDQSGRTITFVSSTEDKDRYGDIIRVAGWNTKSYLKNPIFLWAHDSSSPPIGKCVELHIETSPKPALVQKVEFATKEIYPFADSVFQLYKGGFLNAVSVGFKPLERPSAITDANGDFTGWEFKNQELLELSGTPVPANPAAVARALDAGIVTERDAGRVFVETSSLLRPEGAFFAREILARASKGPVPPCSDHDAVVMALQVCRWWAFDRALAEIAEAMPRMSPELLAAVREQIVGMKSDLDALDAEDFLRDLAAPDPETLNSFLDSLETSL